MENSQMQASLLTTAVAATSIGMDNGFRDLLVDGVCCLGPMGLL